MKQLFFIVGLSAVLIACKTPAPILVPYEVMPITAKPESINSNGVFYALPRQSVNVDIVVRKQEFIKGPYAEFAERLLGIPNAIRDNKTVYSIENVSVSQKAKVDPNQIYFVQFNDSELALEYAKGLIIGGVNTPKSRASEQSRGDSRRQVMLASQTANRRPMVPTFNMFERTDTIFFKQVVDTQLVQRFEIRTVQTEKTALQKAQEIVENIAKIRDDRNRLLTGFQEVNYEAAAIRYMNEEFNRMEDEYIRLFTGTVKTSVETTSFEFLPENRNNLQVVLAGFSSSLGLIPSDSSTKNITLDIVLNDDILTGIHNFSKNIQLPKSGFYYAIPNPGLVRVKLDNQTLFSQQMPFTQFGTVQSLAPELLQIKFFPKTGEIRNVRTIGE